jgi:hypothetical protein
MAAAIKSSSIAMKISQPYQHRRQRHGISRKIAAWHGGSGGDGNGESGAKMAAASKNNGAAK